MFKISLYKINNTKRILSSNITRYSKSTCNFPGMIRLFFWAACGLPIGISQASPTLLVCLPSCINPDPPLCFSPCIKAAIPAWRVALLSGVRFLPTKIMVYGCQTLMFSLSLSLSSIYTFSLFLSFSLIKFSEKHVLLLSLSHYLCRSSLNSLFLSLKFTV